MAGVRQMALKKEAILNQGQSHQFDAHEFYNQLIIS